MSENNIIESGIEPVKAPKFEGIVVDDGSERVPIQNRQGDEIGVFYFRPTDMGIIERYNKFAENFNKVTEPLENIDIKNDGTVDNADAEAVEAMSEAQQRLYAACDELFGGNMSEAFFGKMHPFSPVNGHFYCENAISAVGDYISKVFNKEVKKVQTRVAKYTHGYQSRTGKHKDGRK